MSYSVLEINNLNFSIEKKEILKNLNIKVSKGEFVGLIGPNGAGKSTLLKCINGIYKGSGIIKINGMELNKISEKEVAREVSLMHQDTFMSFPFPVVDVVLMGRYPHIGRFKNESRKDYKVARYNMELTDTINLEKRHITNISGGERQRVLFAKTLTQETNIILLDEPTASLDISYQEQIINYARKLADEGKTVIAAVHDLKIAARYCTKIVLLKDGSILAKGTPEEVITRENLSDAYDVNSIVYRNNVTGYLDFHIIKRDRVRKQNIHVIGGGGSASGIMRYLFENGYGITTGVLWRGDSDQSFADVFGIETVICEPFCEISDEVQRVNINLIKKSDITILCNMPFGKHNIKNLESAKGAQKLIIVEDEVVEGRDYTKGAALTLYNELKQFATITTSARLHEVL